MPLVGYWPLNESSGDAEDYSSYNHNGSITGDITQGVSGLLGSTVYEYGGVDGVVTVSNHSSLQVTGPFSVSYWAYFKDKGDRDHPIITKTTSTGWGVSDGFAIGHGWGTDYYFGTGGESLSTNVGAVENEWYHGVCVFDGSSLILYKNGEKFASQSFTGTLSTTTHDLWIGQHERSSANWGGLLAEVRYYNHALSPLEVQYLYSAYDSGDWTGVIKNE